MAGRITPQIQELLSERKLMRIKLDWKFGAGGRI
jgi:hypothetical protein